MLQTAEKDLETILYNEMRSGKLSMPAAQPNGQLVLNEEGVKQYTEALSKYNAYGDVYKIALNEESNQGFQEGGHYLIGPSPTPPMEKDGRWLTEQRVFEGNIVRVNTKRKFLPAIEKHIQILTVPASASGRGSVKNYHGVPFMFEKDMIALLWDLMLCDVDECVETLRMQGSEHLAENLAEILGQYHDELNPEMHSEFLKLHKDVIEQIALKCHLAPGFTPCLQFKLLKRDNEVMNEVTNEVMKFDTGNISEAIGNVRVSVKSHRVNLKGYDDEGHPMLAKTTTQFGPQKLQVEERMGGAEWTKEELDAEIDKLKHPMYGFTWGGVRVHGSREGALVHAERARDQIIDKLRDIGESGEESGEDIATRIDHIVDNVMKNKYAQLEQKQRDKRSCQLKIWKIWNFGGGLIQKLHTFRGKN